MTNINTSPKEIPHLNTSLSHQKSALRLLATSGDCGSGAGCPSIYESTDGRILVLGNKPSNRDRTSIPIAESEDLVEIPKRLLEAAIGALQKK